MSLHYTVNSCITEPFGFEVLAFQVLLVLFLTEDGLRIIQNVSK